MSAIESLLGPSPCLGAQGTGLTPRTLLVGEDVLVHLQEDATREEVAIYSLPGRLDQFRWDDAACSPWSHAVPLCADGRGHAVVVVDPETGNVFVADVWERAALDSARFIRQLHDHARRHRAWRAALRLTTRWAS